MQPGTYDFLLQLYEQPAGCLVETVGEKVVRVEVSGEDASAGTVDLGEIEVACRAGPRVGSDMRAYEIVDARGRQQLINDLKGRHVLLHVWASWCAPCIATMPEIRATVAELPDERVTFVGLNVDADESRGRALAEKGGWQWAQNYLGDNSNMARQLAISSVPAYYLIDTEGRLAAASGDWAEIKRELRNTLQHSD